MGLYIELFGLVSMFVCFIILIVLDRRQALTKSTKLKFGLFPLAITLYGVWLTISPPKAAPSVQTNSETSSMDTISSYPSSSQYSSNDLSWREPRLHASPGRTSSLIQLPSASETSTSSAVQSSTPITESNSSDFIKGSSATDIKLNLEKWGFSNANPDTTESGDDMLYHSSATDPDTGASLDYSIIASYDFTVKSATFTITNTKNKSQSSFYKLAASFLGYCSTMPYDSAQPEKAKKWIENNISAASKSGKPITCTLGDAKFVLYGNGSSSRMLEIKAGS